MDFKARRDALVLQHADLITRHQQAVSQRDAAVAAVAQIETDLAVIVGRRMENDEQTPPEPKPEPAP